MVCTHIRVKDISKKQGITDVLVIGNKDFQKSTAVKIGVPEENYCDSKVNNIVDWVSEKTNGIGVDVFFECVGKNETINQSVKCTATSGKIMLVGNPHSDISIDKSVYWKILRNQLSLNGTWNSSFTSEKNDDWHYVLEKLKNKNIELTKLISHEFDMKNFEKGLHIMRDKSEDYCKIIMVNSEE